MDFTLTLAFGVSLSVLSAAGGLQPLTEAEADAIVLAEATAEAAKKAALRAKLDSADILSEGETVLPNGQRVIVREVRPPEPVEAAEPATEPKFTEPTPEQLAAFRQAQAKAFHTLHLSIRAYESASYIRWRYADADYAIWSPIQSRHLSGIVSIDSQSDSYLVMMGIGPAADEGQPPAGLSELPIGSYLVAEGDPENSAAFAGIETVIDFYTANAESLQVQAQRRTALSAARKRYEAAHPKSDVPEDFVFQFWIPEQEAGNGAL